MDKCCQDKCHREVGRMVGLSLVILHTKFQLPTRPRCGLKVPGGGGGGGGIESKFSVQLRPKLNKNWERNFDPNFGGGEKIGVP